METPSDRVLSSFLEHAKEGWEVEKYRHYRPRFVMPMVTDEDVKRFESAFCADVRRSEVRGNAW